MRKIIGVFAAVILALTGLTACGSGQAYYTPVSFGEHNRCYYADSAAEVGTLKKQGLCQNSWAAYPMPLYWRQRYFDYYSSPEYRDYYVPKQRRASYDSFNKTFSKTYSSQIKTESSKAKYVSTDGKVVTGNKVPRGSFGGGVRTNGGNGVRICSLGPLFLKGGGGGGGARGGSFGGGSRSFGGGSKVGSGSKGFSSSSNSGTKFSGVRRGGC